LNRANRARKAPLQPIPRSIRVGKKRYSIDVVETMLNKGEMARVYPAERRMQIAQRSNISGKKFKPEQIMDSFWHEVVHAILVDMEEYELNRNERFVTAFANRLTKAIKSARFE